MLDKALPWFSTNELATYTAFRVIAPVGLCYLYGLFLCMRQSVSKSARLHYWILRWIIDSADSTSQDKKSGSSLLVSITFQNILAQFKNLQSFRNTLLYFQISERLFAFDLHSHFSIWWWHQWNNVFWHDAQKTLENRHSSVSCYMFIQ